MALWRAPEAFDPARGAFRTFFLSLVHHRAVDTVRREERLRRRTERAANLEPATGEDPAEDVVEDAYLAFGARRSAQALTTLPPAQRQVLEMAYFEGIDAGADRRGARHPDRDREDQDPGGDAEAARKLCREE